MIKGKKQFGKKRYAKKPRRSKGGTSTIRINKPIVPDRTIVKLPFLDVQPVNPQPTPFQYYAQKTYTVNSIYDPESGVVGNDAPLGYAQWSSIYQRYRVFAVSYEVDLTNLGADTAIAGGLFFASTLAPGAGNVNTWLGQPYTRRFFLGNREGRSSTRIKGSISLPQLMGYTSEQYRTDQLTSANFNANPGCTPIKMYINLKNVNEGVACSAQAMVRLTYHVELFDRYPLANLSITRPDEE